MKNYKKTSFQNEYGGVKFSKKHPPSLRYIPT